MRHPLPAPKVRVLVAALAVAFAHGGAIAQSGGGSDTAELVRSLTSPDLREIGLAIGKLDAVNPWYRVYSGVRGGSFGALDLQWVQRSDDGQWFRADLSHLGQRDPEGSFLLERQGLWRLRAEFGTIDKVSPYTLNTKVSGVGTASLALNDDFRSRNGLGPERELRLERRNGALSGEVMLGETWRLRFNLKGETKEGAIMASSYGSTRSGVVSSIDGKTYSYSAMYFAPQPENFDHAQAEFAIDYFTRQLQLSAGYYGSFFNNRDLALNITPGYNSLPTVSIAAAIPWISLPPDNHSQQFYVSAAYRLSDATRVTMKIAQTRNAQNDAFIPSFGSIGNSATYGQLNPPGVPYALGNNATSLNGLWETTSVAAGLSSRLTRDLDLSANWRYEDRRDLTPQRLYLGYVGTDAANATEYPTGLTNALEPHTIQRGKVELGWRLPRDYRLSGAVEFDRKDTPGEFREYVSEQTVRVDLRKSMSETFNGSISIARADRDGGPWDLPEVPTTGARFSTATAVAAPLQFVDRKRDKARVMVDWAGSEYLSLQAYAEQSKERYPFSPTSGNARMGMTDGSSSIAGVDLGVVLNPRWRLTGYYAESRSRSHQNELYTPRMSGDQNCQTNTVAASCVPWQADLQFKGTLLGVGLRGDLKSLQVGADLMYARDKVDYVLGFDPSYPTAATSSVPAGAGVLPPTLYRLNQIKLFAVAPVDKATSVRVTLIADRRRVEDYAWTGWSFTDGTQVNVPSVQNTLAVLLTLRHAF